MKMSFEFEKIGGKGDLKDKITKKFAALDKYLQNVREDFHKGVIRIVRGERFGYKVKVDVKLPGKQVVAMAKSPKLMDAIDQVYGRSARIIREYLARLKDKKKRD